MKHSDFTISQEFLCGEKRWKCTDIGTRVIVAICLSDVMVSTLRCDDGTLEKGSLPQSEAEREGWFNGPPYPVAETVFDEEDIEACEPVDAITQPAEPGEG